MTITIEGKQPKQHNSPPYLIQDKRDDQIILILAEYDWGVTGVALTPPSGTQFKASLGSHVQVTNNNIKPFTGRVIFEQ